MSRSSIPYASPDISALAKSLRGQLAGRERPPGHVEMLNMLARAAGSRNFQHFRAVAAARPHGAPPAALEAPIDLARVERAARCFDPDGRMVRWPARTADQELCLWALWAALPAGEVFEEGQINAFLKARHLFGDHAILRRSLCNAGLMWRTKDCRAYRRVERRPPAEALALLRRLKPDGPEPGSEGRRA